MNLKKKEKKINVVNLISFKNVQSWTDLCTFKISPIIDSHELMALSE
jgi:hypothetical protein